MITGKIFNIQHFSVHDGPSIRTTVFFKGCPLRCEWCHNPEGLEEQSELSFAARKCIACGACVTACENNVHFIQSGQHLLDREKCCHCGKCEASCPTGALKLIGRTYTVEEVLEEIKRDVAFYEGGGGVTLSGGEPLAQPIFALEIAKRVKALGISVCVETSGYCSADSIKDIAPYVDYFLFDWKDSNQETHTKYTGADSNRIRENLLILNELGANIILRCPVIPERNTNQTHFDGIIEIARKCHHILRIELEPYHALGLEKYEQLGKKCVYLNEKNMVREDIEKWKKYLEKQVTCSVI